MQSRLVRLAIAILIAAAALVLIRFWVDARVNTTQLKDGQTEQTLQVVVAIQPIESGAALTTGNVALKEIPLAMVPKGNFSKLSDVLVDAEGRSRFALAAIAEKEIILLDKVTDPATSAKLSEMLPPGFRAVSIRVNDVQGVAGFVYPGDVVDVLLTRQSGCDASGKACVMVLLPSVKVLAIDQTLLTTPEAPAVAKSVTLAVSAADAQTLVLGGSLGQLSLALRGPAATDSPSLGVLMEGQLGLPRAKAGQQAAIPRPEAVVVDPALAAKAAQVPTPPPAPALATAPKPEPVAAPAPAPTTVPSGSAPAEPKLSIRVLRGTEWQTYPIAP